MDAINLGTAAVESAPAVQPHATQAQSPATPQSDARKPAPPGYSSPTLAIDGVTGSLIVEYRSATSGEEVSQTPSRAALEYEQTQRLAKAAAAVVKDDGSK